MTSNPVSPNQERLLAGLVSSDWHERRESLAALQAVASPDLARLVLEIVRREHGDFSALSGALTALTQLGRPLVEEITAHLDSPDTDLRIYIPLVLGELGDARAVPALTHMALEDENENARFNAIEALGKLRASAAVPALRHVLQSGSPFLRYAAVLALGQAGDASAIAQLLPLLSDPYLADPAVVALGQLAARLASPQGAHRPDAAPSPDAPVTADAAPVDAAVSAITTWMGSELASGDALTGGVMALARFAEIAPQLARAAFLGSCSPLARSRLLAFWHTVDQENCQPEPFWADLARVIGWLTLAGDDPASLSLVIDALAGLLWCPSARPLIEEALAEALHSGISADRLAAALRPVLFDLLDSPQPEAAYAAARLAGQLFGQAQPAGEQAQPLVHLLLEALKAEDETLVALAAEGLGHLPPSNQHDAAGQALLKVLNHPAARVRAAAADALVALQPEGLVERCAAMLQSPDAHQRAASLRLLARLDKQQGVLAVLGALADPEVDVRRTAVELLPAFEDPQVFSALRQSLADPDERLRISAVQSLYALPDPAAVPLLLAAMRDHHGWVRMHAIRAITQRVRTDRQPAEDILPALLNGLHDPLPPVRIAAIEALSLFEGHQVASAIRSLLQDDDQEVQRAVYSALDKIDPLWR